MDCRNTLISLILGAAMLLTAACQKSILQHKLVATGGSHSVPLYPDEHSFLQVANRSQQGGVTGMIGEAQKDFSAREIDDQTPVKVISTDENGDEVEVVQGPMKGQAGFVASQNVQ